MIAFFVLSVMLCGCTDSEKNDVPGKKDNDSLIQESAGDFLPVNDTKDGVIIDDLIGCGSLLGLTADEAGIPRAVIDDSSGTIIKTYADGNIFGVKDYAVIYFERGTDNDDHIISSIWIHIKGVGFDKCKEELSALYGEPYSQGEEPYVEANGGAVMWADFRDGDTLIRLSNASEREYDEIEFYKAVQ